MPQMPSVTKGVWFWKAPGDGQGEAGRPGTPALPGESSFAHFCHLCSAEKEASEVPGEGMAGARLGGEAVPTGVWDVTFDMFSKGHW